MPVTFLRPGQLVCGIPGTKRNTELTLIQLLHLECLPRATLEETSLYPPQISEISKALKLRLQKPVRVSDRVFQFQLPIFYYCQLENHWKGIISLMIRIRTLNFNTALPGIQPRLWSRYLPCASKSLSLSFFYLQLTTMLPACSWWIITQQSAEAGACLTQPLHYEQTHQQPCDSIAHQIANSKQRSRAHLQDTNPIFHAEIHLQSYSKLSIYSKFSCSVFYRIHSYHCI